MARNATAIYTAQLEDFSENTLNSLERGVFDKPKFFENTFAWSVEDVAKHLQCSPRHIRNLICQGRIPFAKVGKIVRFCPERIREWLLNGGTR